MIVTLPKCADVVVVGGGVVGTAITYYLAAYGVDVCLLERDDIASGTSSAAASGVSLQTKPPGPKQDLARASLKLLRALATELEADIEFVNDGGMLVAETEEEFDLIQQEAEAAAQAGVDMSVLSAAEARAQQPELARHVVGATFCPDDSTVNPYLLALAFARAASRLGAKIVTGFPVTGLERHGENIASVQTSDGAVATATVVNAAGPWAPILAEMAGAPLPITPRKGELFVTTPGPALLRGTVISASYLLSKALPSGQDQNRMTVGLWAGQTRRGNLLIGSTREFSGYDRSNTDDGMRALMAQAVRLIPAAANRHVLRFYAGLRPSTPDGLPIFGRAPGLPGLIYANGHEGDGVALSPITGQLIADLLTTRISADDLAPFRPDRFQE
ncbi:NAD(P)/FAD-dependent oxidoreductase [Candidatus Entotheonella palauensis]|nr:FAD-binding oxidoreductase [Candidatus Entotheonella palauensis]